MAERDPRLDFLAPGAVPVEVPVPVVIPLPAPSTKPSIPRKIVKPGYKRDFSRVLRQQAARNRASVQALAEAERLKKLKIAKFAKAGPWPVGFQIGWELGDLLFPHGWYSFAPPTNISPSGWTSPYYQYRRCDAKTPTGNYGTGHALNTHTAPPASSNGSHVCPTDTSSGLVNSRATPVLAQTTAAYPPGQLQLYRLGTGVNPGVAESWVQLTGANWPVPFTAPATADEMWTQNPMTDSAPMPMVRSLPSELPEVFPIGQVMDYPYPQAWADALPKPKTQGESKHLTRGTYSIPQMPLAPFPIVAVHPPPGQVPPPPDQVIDIPPPTPRGGPPSPPPTHHTRPPRGRKPPDSRTKEKKLSVRTKANKAWIVLNLATEAFDFVDALFAGLPDHCKKQAGQSPNPYQKARAVYNCFDEMDWSKFVNAFINQQITDMVVGGIGMVSTMGLKFSGATSGSGYISRNLAEREHASDMAIKAKLDAGEITKEEAQELDMLDNVPIPVVTFNEETGSWEVSIEQWGLTFV